MILQCIREKVVRVLNISKRPNGNDFAATVLAEQSSEFKKIRAPDFLRKLL